MLFSHIFHQFHFSSSIYAIGSTWGFFAYFYHADLDAVWRRGKFRKIQEEVRRIFFSLLFFSDRGLILLLVRVAVVGVVLYLGIFSVGCASAP